ncbi:unnamed protein product [Symbiodinium sp. KB8]|nr:unnamed protein product [Symbiodinium sp. KB8]
MASARRDELRETQRLLLEDFLNSYLVEDPERLPSVRKHKEVLMIMAQRYCILGEKTKKKVIKVSLFKLGGNPDAELDNAVNQAATAVDPGLEEPDAEPQALMDTGEVTMPSPAVHVDMMETQPMDVPETLTVQAIATPLRNINIDGAGRQASKELRPPVHVEPPPTPASLSQQAAQALEVLKAEAADDTDLVDAQRKVVDAARASAASKKLAKIEKKIEKGGGTAAADKPVKKDQQNKAPKAKAKGKARACKPPSAAGEPREVQQVPAAAEAPAAAAVPAAAEAPAAAEVPEIITAAGATWAEAPVLMKCNIPIPDGFEGKRKSYTLEVAGCKSKIQILWCEGSCYVNESNGANGVKVDKKGGSTINCRKNGGWPNAWRMAVAAAGTGAAAACSTSVCKDPNITLRRIDLCDYVSQTNLRRKPDEQIWLRDIDFLELFSGTSTMTKTFRAKNYKSQNYDIMLRPENDILSDVGFAVRDVMRVKEKTGGCGCRRVSTAALKIVPLETPEYHLLWLLGTSPMIAKFNSKLNSREIAELSKRQKSSGICMVKRIKKNGKVKVDPGDVPEQIDGSQDVWHYARLDELEAFLKAEAAADKWKPGLFDQLGVPNCAGIDSGSESAAADAETPSAVLRGQSFGSDTTMATPGTLRKAREVANSSIQPDMSEQDGDDAVADLMGKMTLEDTLVDAQLEELMQEIDEEIKKEVATSTQPEQNTQKPPDQTEAPLQDNARIPSSAPGDQKSQEPQNPGIQNAQKPDQTKAPLPDNAQIPSGAAGVIQNAQEPDQTKAPLQDNAQIPLGAPGDQKPPEPQNPGISNAQPSSAAGDQKSQVDPTMQVAEQLAKALAALSIAPSATQQTLQRPGTVDFSSLLNVLQQGAQASGSTDTTQTPKPQPMPAPKPRDDGQQSKQAQQTNEQSGPGATASPTDEASTMSEDELDEAEKQIQANTKRTTWMRFTRSLEGADCPPAIAVELKRLMQPNGKKNLVKLNKLFDEYVMAGETWGESRITAVYVWMEETHSQSVMKWYTRQELLEKYKDVDLVNGLVSDKDQNPKP